MRLSRALALILAVTSGIVFASTPALASREPGVAIFGDVHVPKGEVHHDDVVCIGGKATIEGTVEGEVVVVGGKLDFSGEAEKVVTVLSDTTFGPTAIVNGEMVHVLGQLERAPEARFNGEIVDVGSRLPRGMQRMISRGLIGLLIMLRFIELLISGLIVLVIALLVPERIERMSESFDERWPASLGYGLLACLAVIVVAIVLAITLIGIPLAVLVGIGAKILGLMGATAILLQVGKKLGSQTGLLHDQSPLLGAVMLGFALVAIIRFIPIVGELVWLVVTILGLGLAVITRLGTRSPEAAAS
jgi:hypothetical protein